MHVFACIYVCICFFVFTCMHVVICVYVCICCVLYIYVIVFVSSGSMVGFDAFLAVLKFLCVSFFKNMF